MSPRAAVVWTPDFLGYDLGDDHPLDPVRLDLTMRLATGLGVLEGVEPLVPEQAPDAEVQRVHVPSYLTAVKSAPEAPFRVGHGLGTEDNPIFPGMHEASALVCGGSLLAAREIAEGRADRAVNIAGGLHHAMADRAAGFCVYNDCAVAISWLLDHGFDRIAYVDVDVHHGDGVQAAFYADPRVLTISLHQHPLTLWPGTGWPGEDGAGPAPATRSTCRCRRAPADSGWLRAFHAVVPSLLGAFRPQILVTQCGVDTHAEDPLANLGLSVDGHRAIYRALRELADEFAGGTWLAVGGGGYGLFRVVPRSWTHLLATVLDRDVEPRTGRCPADWAAHTARLTRQPLPTAMTDGRATGHAAVDRGRRPGRPRGPRHPARGLPAARPRPATTPGTDVTDAPPASTSTATARPPTPPGAAPGTRATRGTGRPTCWPPTGGIVHLRPILPSDADALVRFHESLSERTRYLRYFGPYPRISPRDLERFTTVDHRARVAFICLLGDEIIAVGRYEGLPGDGGPGGTTGTRS